MPGWSLAQDPGRWDGGDEAALAPKASDSRPVLVHFSGESVPRAWESAVSNRLPWVRLPERTTSLTVAFLAPTGLWYAIWKFVPVWFTEAFWTRSSMRPSRRACLAFPGTCQRRRDE